MTAKGAPFKVILSTNQCEVIEDTEAHVTQPLRHSCEMLITTIPVSLMW
ncbi:MAG TPA: hypothetical protein VHP14_17515 [Anaerolineales bacterium]|nr:hypothetical protein [Anaerolineales bacterium]